jgi:phage major head subunit gpT-like protein
MAVERKLYDDDLYNVINPKAQRLGTSFARTREIHAASTFNNAFSASFTGFDAVALCSASHPLSPQNTGTVQSNAGSSALSPAAIEATRQIMLAYTDDRGNLFPSIPDILLVPPALEQTATEILRTVGKVDSADNTINFVGSLGLRPVVWNYLTDTNDWFLIDSRLMKQHLWWFDRVETEFQSDPNSDYTMVARYRGYMRYIFGWDDWMWIYGHHV